MDKFQKISFLERPVIFGEVLFDIFPNGRSVLGGAPFNVAWHLQGFGLNPLFISRIGKDRYGEKVIESMDAWGMDRKGIQIDDHHPTGTVRVSLQQGQPQFTILPEQAYDFISSNDAFSAIKGDSFSCLYHGTLICRTPVSSEVLDKLRDSLDLPIFLDVNLRPPWWEREGVRESLKKAKWGKLNDAELAELFGKEHITIDELEQVATKVRDAYDLEFLILTRGAEGAMLVRQNDILTCKADKREDIIDTVGAGDAFSAIMILGIYREWAPNVTLQRAVKFASDICLMRGATTREQEFYEYHLKQWEEESA